MSRFDEVGKTQHLEAEPERNLDAVAEEAGIELPRLTRGK